MPSSAEILARIKARDNAEQVAADGEGGADPANFGQVVLLRSNPMLAVLAAAWSNVPPSRDPEPAEVCEAPESEWVRWYWSRLEPDPIPIWLRTAGLPDAPHTRRACWMAIDNGMIHPDGGLATWTERYVRQFVFDTLTARS